ETVGGKSYSFYETAGYLGKIGRKLRKVESLSQNARGIKSDGSLDELLEILSNRKAITVCLQEILWKYGRGS
ncbi:Hypothetical predicted protein, partial [Paramuricea clavata]